MIITCEECQTQFQLDDSRIPERGARVRCSRCKHAFFVKPAAEAGDSVDHAVEQALAEDEEKRSGSTQELGPAAALSGETEEESDWQFNQDEPDPGPDLAAAQEVVDDLLGPLGEELPGAEDDELLSSDLDVDDDIDSLLDSSDPSAELEEAEPAEPVIEEPEAEELVAEEPAAEEPAAEEPVAEEPVAEELGAEELAAEGPVAEELVAEEPEASPPLQIEARAAEDELGSPENWDFFVDEPEGSPSEEADFEQTPVDQTPLASHPALERPPIEVDAEPSKMGQRLRLVVHAAGWLSVALLMLGGLHGGIVPQRTEPPTIRTAQAAAGFEATAVEGRWLDNAAAGQIYVISGQLRRVGSRPLAPGAWLAVRLFDEEGRLLTEAAGVVGPALPEERLREENPRELRAAQEALAMGGAPLLPGDALAFQAILTQLPEAASRFDLAAVPVEP